MQYINDNPNCHDFSYYKKIYKKILLIEKKDENKFGSIIIFEDGEQFRCQLLSEIKIVEEVINIPLMRSNYMVNYRFAWEDVKIRIITEDLEFFINKTNQIINFSLLNISEDGTNIIRWIINGYISSFLIYESNCFDLDLKLNHAVLTQTLS